MWFTPVGINSEGGQATLLRRVGHIIEVVEACRSSNYEWLEQLVEDVSFQTDISQFTVQLLCFSI